MKTERIVEEIGKTKAKISDLQAKLRDLERQKTEQENGMILELVRSIDVSPQELTAMLRLIREDRLKEAMASQAPALPEDGEDTDGDDGEGAEDEE
jgi:hypothetical protein